MTFCCSSSSSCFRNPFKLRQLLRPAKRDRGRFSGLKLCPDREHRWECNMLKALVYPASGLVFAGFTACIQPAAALTGPAAREPASTNLVAARLRDGELRRVLER